MSRWWVVARNIDGGRVRHASIFYEKDVADEQQRRLEEHFDKTEVEIQMTEVDDPPPPPPPPPKKKKRTVSCDSTPEVVDLVFYFDGPEEVNQNAMTLLLTPMFGLRRDATPCLSWHTVSCEPGPDCGVPRGCARTIVTVRKWDEWKVRKCFEIAALIYSREKRSAYIRKKRDERHVVVVSEYLSRETIDSYIAKAEEILAESRPVDLKWF